MKRFAAALAAAFALGAPVAAEANSCAGFEAQMKASNPELMARVAGMWVSQVGANGVATRSTWRFQLAADGKLLFDRTHCLINPNNGREECYPIQGHGFWAAHMGQDGSIFLARALSGVGGGYTCGGEYLRFVGPHALQSVTSGAVTQRVAPAG